MKSRYVSDVPLALRRTSSYLLVLLIVATPVASGLGYGSDPSYWPRFGLTILLCSFALAFARDMAKAFESYVSPGTSPPGPIPKKMGNPIKKGVTI